MKTQKESQKRDDELYIKDITGLLYEDESSLCLPKSTLSSYYNNISQPCAHIFH